MARPLAYNPEDVLQSAKNVFWTRGYEAASLDVLTRETGLGKSSLYHAFGSKHALYLAVLDSYGKEEMAAAASILDPTEPVLSLRTFLSSIPNAVRLHGDRRGCLLCNASIDVAQSHPDVAARVKRHFSPVLDRLHTFEGMTNAQANHILATFMGLQVMARGGFGPDAMDLIIDETVSAFDRARRAATRP